MPAKMGEPNDRTAEKKLARVIKVHPAADLFDA